MDNLAREISQAAEAAFIDSKIEHSLHLSPSIIDNSRKKQNDVLSHIKKELKKAKEFLFSVSFIRMSGLEMLIQTFKDIENTGVVGKIITTDYLNYTEPKALHKLLSYQFIEVRIVTEEAFHTKGYFFSDGKKNTVIIGSSNITGGALKSNREWNIRASALDQGGLTEEFKEAFDELWETAIPLTESWLQAYGQRYDKELEIRHAIEQETRLATYTIEPNQMQKAAALSLHKMRENGKNKALLIAATGTGKTYLSAFDVRSVNPKHMLFIVHREQILHDAADSFIDILGTSITKDIGFITGNKKDFDKKYIFSTIQMMSKPEIHQSFNPDYFDYMIIDEVHKAAAPSYRRIMSYFKPAFLLGMSATPDRPDKENIYELFDYNIALDIRLKDALENNLLCPFHYFGIADITIDGKTIQEEADFNDLTADERVLRILEKSEYYGFSGERVKGLIFCSHVKEAKLLAEKINESKKNDSANWKAAYVTGETSIELREEYVRRLQYDDDEILDFIITVDTFNEGIDIPEVNQVIMLRPTESSIIFIQQLGRGLRKNARGKEYLVAIDFIGNYKKSFLIPVALSGDNTYDKDNLRKYITEGSSVIPGCSTIDFDLISKDLIYRNIDNSNLRQFAFLKKEYFSLKNRLGRIPSIADFHRENAIDVLNFIDYAGSYYSFLRKADDEYEIELSKDEETVLKFVSRKFEDGKRRAELTFFRIVLDNYKEIYNMQSSGLLTYKLQSEQISLGKTLNSMISNLDMSFLKKQEAQQYGSTPLISIRNNVAIPSDRLSNMMKNPSFRNLLSEVIDDGLRRNSEQYKTTYADTPFVLYEKYTYEDVCRLLCWETNMNPLNIGGYFYDTKTKTLPVFVNYEKEDSAIPYPDKFLDENNIITFSKKNRRIGCPDYNHIYKTQKSDMDNMILLFVRKNTVDERKEFYFLGKIEAYGKAEAVKIEDNNGKKTDAFAIHYQISTPVRRDIFDYLIS